MIDEYTFTCRYCGDETLTNEPRPNATWTRDYRGSGWVCGQGQCQETLSEEPIHINAEKRHQQILKKEREEVDND